MLALLTGLTHLGLVALLGGVLARRLWTPGWPRLWVPALGAGLLLLGWGGQLALTLSALGFTAPADVLVYLTGTGPGRSMLLALLGAALLLAAETGRWPWLALPLAAAVVVWGAAGVGHGAGHGVGVRALHAAHAAAMCVWLGGVLTLLRRGSPELARRFSPVAVACVLTLALTGLAMAGQHLRLPSAWTGTPYGQTLLLKLGAVAVTLGLALGVRRALARGQGLRAPLRREALGLLAVLALTALLVTQPPPAGHATHAAARLELP
ncbi:CopD family protein [Deinococcus multiflagellatus]|uniref:CopD family protein n=1 Tax=Deinococcus multiflagellatus TaxID=1656887 RepID=A0ABW1ZV14_9DEIO|nr:CopD family protein [Deinococcus multiflagellatus]MBZ9713521.1 CopD family protein [Deinococcus multiflagellatus]